MISLLSFGPRASLGFFLTPMSQDNGWDRDVFGLALAIQNILWGVGQPLAGAIADRYGTVRVLCAGGLFYALGLTLMAYSTTPGMLDLGGGVFVGLGFGAAALTSLAATLWGRLMAGDRPPAGERWSTRHPLPKHDAAVAAAPGTRPEFTSLERHYRIDTNTRAPSFTNRTGGCGSAAWSIVRWP